MDQAKPLGIPTLISLYEKIDKENPLLQQLKISADYGEVMPNITQMARFFSAVGAALQIATQGQATAQAALQEAEANMRHQ
jgi:maltose/maltodextrin transport system substrate-binding protein